MYTGSGLADMRPVTSAVGGGLLATGGILAAIPGLQLPGAIVAAAGVLTQLIGSLFKPDLTKIEATHIVDQIEAEVLKPMLASWESLPADQKTSSTQAAYLSTFDQAWAAVLQGCRNPALGSAGQACIADRQQGACHYQGADGQCANWFTWYRDPIQNDPDVHGDLSVAGIFGGSPSSMIPLAIAGLIALAVAS